MTQTKVNIVTVTYNQEDIIAQTIDALLAQKTNFDFEIIIGEDCSTDNTLKIVQEYQRKHQGKIRIITSDMNVGIEENYLRCYKACQAKYVAICDGDDYWIDPLKLQKQVDFFEKHSDFGLLGTMIKYYDERTHEFVKGKSIDQDYIEYSFDSLFIENPLTSSSVIFRKDLLEQFLDLYQKFKVELNGFIDYSLWMYFASKMKVAELNDVTTVCRLSDTNISRNKDFKKSWQYRKRNYKHYKFFNSFVKGIDRKTKNKAAHNRAVWYYRLTAVNADVEVGEELLSIFESNKDYVRYCLFRILLKFPKLHPMASFYEKVRAKFLTLTNYRDNKKAFYAY